MAADAFIQLRDGSVLCTALVLQVFLRVDNVIFVMRDGKTVTDAWPTGEGATAYANYLSALAIPTSGTPTFVEIEPATVPHDLETLANIPIVLTGTNFPPASYFTIDAFAFTKYVNSTRIYDVWAGADMTVGARDVVLKSGGGTVLFTQAGAFTVT